MAFNGLESNKGIVYLLGFEWCNPNGDPGMDNAPRIYEDKLFTTDVFLKRRIRDYIYDKYGKKDEGEYLKSTGIQKKINIIFLRRDVEESGEILTPEGRAGKLKINNIEDAKKLCWDVRVFGALIPIKKGDSSKKRKKSSGEKGEGWSIYGPAQFTFGTSIHDIDYFDVQITNVLAHSKKAAKGGSMGVKQVVPVAIVEYFGFVNAYTAEDSGMDEEDYEKLIEALKNLREAHSSNTATKNLIPLLIIEVDFEDKYMYLKGLMKCVKEPRTSIREAKIDISELVQRMKDENLNYNIYVKKEFKEIFEGLPTDKSKIEEF
ncbi:MAG TPA: hypothetical protein EYH09_01015 [Candidatus Nanopusillus sp.]|nr:hypothetical protein [Candidatus Nanopusillus sp.]